MDIQAVTDGIRRDTGFHRRAMLLLASIAIALAWGGTAVLAEADGSARGGWYRVALEHGETNGYHWGVRATGPKSKPAGRICTVVGKVAPLDPELGYVEASETQSCGRLSAPTDSVSTIATLGSSEVEATMLWATVYPPIVRKIVFVLGAGERKVSRTIAADGAGKAGTGVPLFRYVVALFEGESCIRRIVALDGHGDLIENERAEPGC